ncbi:hypothetical protein ACTTBA_03995 [Shewanella frigidimarina]|uniref:hypothetical protein n=1 Tax=Shewanella frigidimarina TaxID=56812 RepID=UPI003F9F2F59
MSDESKPLSDDIELYKISDSLRSHFHNSLWEEEKHYTWLISIIFGAIILITVRMPLDEFYLKLFVLFFLSGFGGIITKIAYSVIDDESRYFQIAFHRHVKFENKIFSNDPEQIPSREWNTPQKWPLLLKLIFTDKRLGVRGNFLVTFVLFDKVFLFIAALCAILFLNDICNLFIDKG